MAYSFLNTTTYTNQLAAQEQLLSGMIDVATTQSPLGAGFDLSSYDSDLVEIVSGDYTPQDDTQMSEDLIEQPEIDSSSEDEPEPDDRIDMELINSMFIEEPASTPKPKTRTVYVEKDDEEDDNSNGRTYRSDGSVKPRIWQYGGKPSKYQVGGVALPHTNLTQAQDSLYQQWRSKLPLNLQNEQDYNLRQMFIENPNTRPSTNMHFPDKYKMPNHPTFSNESMYFNPSNQYLAGSWNETDSSWNYTPYNNQFKKTIVERKQLGGTLYADDYETQRIGLNDPNYSRAVLNLEGTNTIRGLDSRQPVAVTDGKKYQILHGPQDTAKFSGKVYEQKLKMQTGGSTRKSIYTSDPNDPRIKAYNDSLNLSKSNIALAYGEQMFENKEDFKKNFNAQTIENVGLYKDGKWVEDTSKYKKGIQPVDYADFTHNPSQMKELPYIQLLYKAPVQPVQYRELEPSKVSNQSFKYNINIPDNGYTSTDLSQKPTKYSASYRDGNQQKTIYFKDKNTWKSFLDTGALSNVDTSETENRASATGYRALQFGGELKPETGEVKEFYNQYLNSPNYLKRLNTQGYVDPNQAILDRLANIKSVTTTVDDMLGSQYNAPNYTVIYNPKDAKEFGFPMQSVLAHEYGHTIGGSQGKYLTNPNLELNQNEMNAFSSRNKLRNVDTTGYTEQQKMDVEHDSRPSESKADLDALRFLLNKDKIYNTGTQQFTPELLQQAKEKYKNDNIVNRLFQNYSDEDLIYLMNNIAYNNTNNRQIYG